MNSLPSIKLLLITLLLGALTFGGQTALPLLLDSDYTTFSEEGSYIELSGRANPDAALASIGVWGKLDNNVTLKAGLSFLGSESLEDTFGGLTFDIQYSTDLRVSPIIGVGVFFGYSSERVPARNDGIDNNNNGFIDERGETKSQITNVISAIYPEAGVRFHLTEKLAISLSAKHYFSSEGEAFNFTTGTLGLYVTF